MFCRCLPYFYIAGQPKCGTTDLFHSLVLHPQIVMPVAKEPHWWARGRFGVKSLQSFKSYVKMFAPLVTELVSGHRTDLVTGDTVAIHVDCTLNCVRQERQARRPFGITGSGSISLKTRDCPNLACSLRNTYITFNHRPRSSSSYVTPSTGERVTIAMLMKQRF